MKKRINNIIITILIVLSVITCFTYKVKADSGWDTSYDSGSSWSSSDYSSSSHSSSYSSSYSSSSYGSSHHRDWKTNPWNFFDTLGMIMILSVYFGPVIIFPLLTKRRKNRPRTIFRGLTDDEIKKIDPTLDIEEFKKYVYDSFVAVQEAWMDFDYEKLRNYLTDELYNMYVMDLEILKQKNQKNIMKEFQKNTIRITSINKTNDIETINTSLLISFKDYVVDENNNVVRGNKNTVYENEYILTYVKKGTTSINKCPKCGAEIEDKASTKCLYCRSTILPNNYNFVLSKKTKISQNIVRR